MGLIGRRLIVSAANLTVFMVLALTDTSTIPIDTHITGNLLASAQTGPQTLITTTIQVALHRRQMKNYQIFHILRIRLIPLNHMASIRYNLLKQR